MANLPKLKSRWLKLCAQNNLHDAESEWLRIISAYREPHRAYHNLDHIEHCLELFDEHWIWADNPTAMELALWYHDIIYDTHAGDNEEQSAQAAAEFLTTYPHKEAVAELILATRHTGEFLPNDLGVIADIDMAILGAPASAYDAYADKIRQEYAWVDPKTYAQKRSQLLQRFLDEGIYTSIIFEEEQEEQAQENLQREIKRLSQGQ